MNTPPHRRALRGVVAVWVGCLTGLGLLCAPCAAQDADAQPTPPLEQPQPPTRAPEPPAATPAPETPDASDDGLTEEERRLLEESLGEDSKLREARELTQPIPATAGMPALQSPRQAQNANPDMSFILDTALGYFSDEPLQSGAHDPNKTGFTFQQLELSITSNVDPFFAFTGNIVFAQFGVEVEEAYATTTALPGNLQVRAGQFLTRFGRINSTHPHAWHFADQPLVLGKFFGGENNRGLGVEGSWLSPLPWFLEVVTSLNDATGDCCARSYYGSQDPGTNGPEDLLVTQAVKQFFPLSDAWSLLWGVSAQFGPNPSGQGNRTEIYATDLYLRYRPPNDPWRSAVSLQVEAMSRNRQVPGDVLRDQGGYAQLVWNIDFMWEVGARAEWVSGVVDDPLDPDWDGDRTRYAAQATFYPSHFARLRLQGARDAPSWRPEPIWMAFLALEVVVGAHGAHKF